MFSLIIFAGTPTASTRDGRSRVTTAPAPTTVIGPMFYNWVGLKQYKLRAESTLPTGKVAVRFVFDYDGGGVGKGGSGTLYLNDEKVAEGRIDHTASFIFSPYETA